MKVYPDVPAKRHATVVGDIAVACLLVLFASLAWPCTARSTALPYSEPGYARAAPRCKEGLRSAADRVNGVPLVGGSLADALQGAGRQSGGRVAALGRQGEEDVHRLALILGLVVFALPTILVLALLLPRRVRQIKQLTAAERVLTDPDDPQRRRVLAMRAAFGLPYGTLVAYTPDPLGDIVQNRYDALVQAAMDEAGIRHPPTTRLRSPAIPEVTRLHAPNPLPDERTGSADMTIENCPTSCNPYNPALP